MNIINGPSPKMASLSALHVLAVFRNYLTKSLEDAESTWVLERERERDAPNSDI